jgi:chromate transporter
VEVEIMSLYLLAQTFFVLSLVAFGAATSVIPDLHRVLVDNYDVMTAEEFSGLFAMSQAAPGTNVMFVAVLGWQALGLSGAFVSMFAFCTPTAVMALSVERFGARFRDARWQVSLRRAIAPITVGLLFATGYLLGRSTPTLGGIAIAAGATAVLSLTKVSPLWLTAIGAITGALGLI